MKLKTLLSALAASTVLTFGSVNATVITVETFDLNAFNTAIDGAVAIEDFESIDGFDDADDAGQLSGPLSSVVGSFTSAGVGTNGSGGTCGGNTNSSTCTQVALEFGDNSFDQGNLVPLNGMWSLNNNDTNGIVWDAFLAGGEAFNRLVFGIKDPADIKNVEVNITVGQVTQGFGPSLPNANEQLVIINFSEFVTQATVEILNSNTFTNDSFSIDGATIAVNEVTSPALISLMGMTLIAVAGLGRRRKA